MQDEGGELAGAAGAAVEATVRQPAELVNAKLLEISTSFYLALPNIIAGVVFLLIAWVMGKFVRRGIAAIARRRGRPDLGNVAGSLTQGVFMLAAILIAAAIVFPSVLPADVLATLGIGSVAIGFAFKDILQNLFAGLLILIRRPYMAGDEIKVGEFEGTVESIESRATMLRTYDNRRVVIPNSDIYTKSVVVLTAYPTRRDEYDVGIGYGEDPMAVCERFREAVRDVPGVMTDPGPECFPWELAASTFTLRVRWWVLAERSDLVQTRARVLNAIFQAALEDDIDLPYPTSVSLVKGDRLDDALLEAGAAADGGVSAPDLGEEKRP
ncbi:MAG: mechanosensitive ion channel [Pacificimonas sp.]|jgi:small-conductance mechanosensitive channel|nr:mechanosensitive ion channel [Pacificimonas sp.]